MIYVLVDCNPLNDFDCAWVFAGGEFSYSDFPFSELADHHQIICVDRGVEHCLELGLSPTLLVGDFDSASEQILRDERLREVPRQTYSSDKAASDLELALDILCKDPPNTVVILGVSGGRTDHMLFNWMLPGLRQWPFSLQLVDATVRCYVLAGPGRWEAMVSAEQALAYSSAHNTVSRAQALVPGEQSTKTRAGSAAMDGQVRFGSISLGQTISLLALSETTGVSTQGLEYPLENADLRPGSTLGLSNVVVAGQSVVSVERGTLLIMLYREYVR